MVAKKNCVLPAVTLACVGEITMPTETRCGGMEPEPPPQPGNENNDETRMAARIGRRLGISSSIFSRKLSVVAWKSRCSKGNGRMEARHSGPKIPSTRAKRLAQQVESKGLRGSLDHLPGTLPTPRGFQPPRHRLRGRKGDLLGDRRRRDLPARSSRLFRLLGIVTIIPRGLFTLLSAPAINQLPPQ